MQCAEYVAAGLNAPPESDTQDYSYEDENTSGNADLHTAVLSDTTVGPISQEVEGLPAIVSETTFL